MTQLPRRALNVLLAMDETANSLLGGKPTETVSGTIGRALMQKPVPIWAKIARVLVDRIFGQGHCAFNALAELDRRKSLSALPPDEQ